MCTPQVGACDLGKLTGVPRSFNRRSVPEWFVSRPESLTRAKANAATPPNGEPAPHRVRQSVWQLMFAVATTSGRWRACTRFRCSRCWNERASRWIRQLMSHRLPRGAFPRVGRAAPGALVRAPARTADPRPQPGGTAHAEGADADERAERLGVRRRCSRSGRPCAAARSRPVSGPWT